MESKLMKRINIQDIDLNSLEVILDKAGRWVDGINHGRKILRDKDSFYKVFDMEYCRRQNFIDAYEFGFFDGLAPALKSLIVDGDDIIGYITESGQQLSTSEFDFDSIPKEFYKKVIDATIVKEMFFYDLVPINIIKTKDGKISLIDLESVYPIEELFQIDKHNAKVKPDFYFEDLEKIWKENMKAISFIQPSRNNLKYLKWSYDSIRKNLGSHHEICWADDYSDDGTWEWMNEIAEKDPNVKIHRNEGPNRLGHTILYDTLVNDYATNDIVMIYHADMYACPYMDTEILKLIKPGTVVSATRIEPPLHPDGPEKILRDFGIEPEEFKEDELLEFMNSTDTGAKPTKGIFAPWAIYKKDFQEINGHDPLYAPQSKEDSDIFNRFVLNGYELIQTWKGFVYHMTCRGSRFKDGALRNPAGQVFMKGRESSEWLEQNLRSTRNFIRKWGHMVKHDEMMYPIIPPKYDIGFVVKNCDYNLLKELEPWCSTIYIEYTGVMESYVKHEQKDTEFNLSDRIKHSHQNKPNNDIIIEFDAKLLNSSNFQILVELSSILKESGEVGEMELEIFKFNINSLKTYEKDLIKV
jgi:glycosyltransferase involved in cell wall biosynthesis|tara:strand:+ start:291 stop:2036 length:1746 start_codon:yes stop_codon:yes gene_type:complete